MSVLTNLVVSPSTRGQWVPRPASISKTTFSSFSGPAQEEALLVVGNIAYGMIASGLNPGKSQPFAFNLLTNTFETITGITSANTPTSQPTSGDWTPSTMAIIGSRVIVTHPGFSGTGNFFGWLDISGFTSASLTGDTHNGTKVIDNLSSNPIAAGFAPGMTIAGTDIATGARVVSLTTTEIVVDINSTGDNMSSTLTVAGGTATSPQWSAGNTNGAALSAIPVAVAQFNGRAWYAVPKGGMVFSDAGQPTQVTNATQALVPNNGLDVTAFGGVPYSQLIGGALQALIAFQGDAQMQQVTGDSATMNLSMNEIGVGVGCLAPNTICNTTMGLAFVAPDGLRFLGFNGEVSNPIGANGKGVNVPFLEAITPSRMCAAFNQNVLRLSVINGAETGQPVQEYWFDMNLKVWGGPHTFPASLIQPYQAPTGATSGHGFIMAAAGINAELWDSAVTPTLDSIYMENGAAMQWQAETVLLPDNLDMAENAMVQTAIGFSSPGTQTMSVTFTDENANILNQVTLPATGTGGTLWGVFTWGAADWSAVSSTFVQRRIDWTEPLVFKQGKLMIGGNSIAGFALGNIYMRIQALGYLVMS